MFPVPLGAAMAGKVLHSMMRKGHSEASSYACAPGIFCLHGRICVFDVAVEHNRSRLAGR